MKKPLPETTRGNQPAKRKNGKKNMWERKCLNKRGRKVEVGNAFVHWKGRCKKSPAKG